MLLSGCGGVERYYDSRLPFDTPIDWWHGLQGGALADERPPPPGVTDPYPNLSQIPARPAPSDPAARQELASERQAGRWVAPDVTDGTGAGDESGAVDGSGAADGTGAADGAGATDAADVADGTGAPAPEQAGEQVDRTSGQG